MSIDIFSQQRVLKLIDLALEEDQARQDFASLLCVPSELNVTAEIVARQQLITCGLQIISAIIEKFNADLTCIYLLGDGMQASANQVIARISGKAQHVLALERTFLNFLQRLCGVATYTNNFISQSTIKVYDTRKTLPGWRALDKYAVRIGGGFNHRMNLAELIMIKDTHIKASQGIINALKNVFANKPHDIAVEIEVSNLTELAQALEFPVKIIMLDNFDIDNIVAAAKLARAKSPKVLLEVSGGINSERLNSLSQLDIDFVSVGALTTQAINVDIAMQVL